MYSFHQSLTVRLLTWYIELCLCPLWREKKYRHQIAATRRVLKTYIREMYRNCDRLEIYTTGHLSRCKLWFLYIWVRDIYIYGSVNKCIFLCQKVQEWVPSILPSQVPRHRSMSCNSLINARTSSPFVKSGAVTISIKPTPVCDRSTLYHPGKQLDK